MLSDSWKQPKSCFNTVAPLETILPFRLGVCHIRKFGPVSCGISGFSENKKKGLGDNSLIRLQLPNLNGHALWSELTYNQFIKAGKNTETAVLIIRGGWTHGTHLPLGTDCILPSYLGEKVAKKTDALVLPTIPFGYSWSFLPFKGTISIQPDNLTRFYQDIMSSVSDAGFRFIIALNGHGGNYSSLQQAAKRQQKKERTLSPL